MLQNRRIHKFYHQILLFDPGLQSLYRATRTVFSALTAVAIAALVFQYLTPVKVQFAPILAGFLGMVPTFAINDPDTKARIKILFLAGLAVALAISAGTFLHQDKLLQNVVFLLIVFLAFYLRKFSRMFVPLGMITFIGYYFTFFLPVTTAQLPYLLLAIVIGISTSFIFMFVLFPERQTNTTRYLYHSWETLAARFCTYSIDVLQYGRDAYYKKLDITISELTQLTTTITDQLPSQDIALFRKYIPAQQVQLYLFDSVLALNTMYRFFKEDKIEGLQIKDRDTLIEVMKLVRSGFRLHTLRIKEKKWRSALQKVQKIEKQSNYSSLSRLYNGIRWLTDDLQLLRVPGEIDQTLTRQSEPYKKEDTGILAGTTVQALKAVIAVLLCIFVGSVFPLAKPYWIIQTAFVVLVNAETVGQIYSRGLYRLLGTLFGAVAGFVLAVFIGKILVLKFVFIFLSIFLAFYLFSRSYAYMSFWITVMLALLYDILLGGVPGAILYDRVIDTLLGVVIGFAVSLVILLRKEQDIFKTNIYEYLKQLKMFLEKYLEYIKKQQQEPLINDALTLTVKLQQIRDIVSTMRTIPGYDHTSYNDIALLVRSLNYQVVHLQSPSSRLHVPQTKNDVYTYSKKLIDLIQDNIENVTAYIDQSKQLRPALAERVVPDIVRNDKHTFLIVHHLARINELVIRLGDVIEQRKIV